MQNLPAGPSRDKAPLEAKAARRDTQLAAVVQKMTAELQELPDRRFFVGLVGYSIDGHVYHASGLSMNAYATPQIRVTGEGFSCVAFFPPEMLLTSTVRQHGVIQKRFGGQLVDVVRVRVEVRFKDVFSVFRLLRAQGQILFFDRERLMRP